LIFHLDSNKHFFSYSLINTLKLKKKPDPISGTQRNTARGIARGMLFQKAWPKAKFFVVLGACMWGGGNSEGKVCVPCVYTLCASERLAFAFPSASHSSFCRSKTGTLRITALRRGLVSMTRLKADTRDTVARRDLSSLVLLSPFALWLARPAGSEAFESKLNRAESAVDEYKNRLLALLPALNVFGAPATNVTVPAPQVLTCTCHSKDRAKPRCRNF